MEDCAYYVVGVSRGKLPLLSSLGGGGQKTRTMPLTSHIGTFMKLSSLYKFRPDGPCLVVVANYFQVPAHGHGIAMLSTETSNYSIRLTSRG